MTRTSQSHHESRGEAAGNSNSHNTPAGRLVPPLPTRAPDGRFTPPADGWYHLVPLGNFSHAETRALQLLDDKALEAMRQRFDRDSQSPNFPGLLIDFDHFSYDPGRSSEAAGWLQALERRADGLWGRIKWSDKGEEAVKNGRYRFVSPTWLREDCELVSVPAGSPSAESPRRNPDANRDESGPPQALRPLRLDSLALTNSPNLRGMAPLSNRTHNNSNTIPGSRDLGTAMSRDNPNKMKSVCSLLGLSSDAAEEAVHHEVAKLQNRLKNAEETATPLKNRVSQLESENSALLAAQVESDLELHQNRFPAAQRENWKRNLLANRAATIELLRGLPEAPATPASREGASGSGSRARIHNRETAGDPGQRLAREAANADADGPGNRAQAAAIRNRAIELRAAQRKLTYDQAFKMAKNELTK